MGRDAKNEKREHWTKLTRSLMEEPAWQALSSAAQALYPWLLLEWHGPDHNNNGKIRLSVRQAAERMGIGVDAALRSFHDLQAKGFLVVTEIAHLGISSKARGTSYELTEIGMPHRDKPSGRKLFREWREGHDFPVRKATANNPKGRNGKTKAHHQNHDRNVIEIGTVRDGTS